MKADLPSPVPLPFSRVIGDLPGPLPTAAEICAASKSSLSLRRSAFGDQGGVCLVRDMFIVKYGPGVSENEGNALLYLEQQPLVPSPRLFAMYRDQTHGHLHLVMEYLPGVDLETVWDSLSAEDRSSIATQLQTVVAHMRSLHAPSSASGICGGAMPNAIFQTEEPDSKVNGPFEDVNEVGSALASILERQDAGAGFSGWMPKFLFRHLSSMLCSHEVRLTHGDIRPKNIRVLKGSQESATEKPSKGTAGATRPSHYVVTGIVDWESAGWYPDYWEYVSSCSGVQHEDDWVGFMDSVLDPYPGELLAFPSFLQYAPWL